MKDKRPFWVRVKGFVRLRPLGVVLAMILIHVGSRDATLHGFLDRLVQTVAAYVVLCAVWPKQPNDQAHRRQKPQEGNV